MSFVKAVINTITNKAFITIITFFAGIVNARSLGPEGLGVLALLLTLKNLGFRVGNLGFGSAFAYHVAKNFCSIRRCINMIIYIVPVVSIIYAVVAIYFWNHPMSPWRDIKFLYICTIFATLPFTLAYNYIQRCLSGKLLIKEINKASLLSAIFYLIFSIVFLTIFKMMILGAVVAILLTEIIGVMYIIKLYKKNNVVDELHGLDQTEMIQLWKYGRWSYALMIVNYLVEELPTILIKMITASNFNVGIFNRAKALSSQIRVVILPFAEVLFPYTASSENKVSINRTNVICRNFLLLTGVFLVCASICIKSVIVILYGKDFMPAIPLFYALLPGLLLWPVGHFLAIHISAQGNPRVVALQNIFILVAALLLCIVLTKEYGMFGTALSVSFTSIISVMLRIYSYGKLYAIPYREILIIKKTDIQIYKYYINTLLKKYTFQNIS